jgi:hypothetical protein
LLRCRRMVACFRRPVKGGREGKAAGVNPRTPLTGAVPAPGPPGIGAAPPRRVAPAGRMGLRRRAGRRGWGVSSGGWRWPVGTVQRLRVPRLRHEGVRLEEAAQHGVVVAGVVKVQANGSIFPLSCKAVGRRRGAVGVAGLPLGFVAQLRHPIPTTVRRDGGGAQACPERSEGWSVSR